MQVNPRPSEHKPMPNVYAPPNRNNRFHPRRNVPEKPYVNTKKPNDPRLPEKNGRSRRNNRRASRNTRRNNRR